MLDKRARRWLYASAVPWATSFILLLGDSLLNMQDHQLLDDRGASVLGMWGVWSGFVATTYSVFAIVWVFTSRVMVAVNPILRERERRDGDDGDGPPRLRTVAR